MNQTVETIIKAVLILAGVFVGTETLKIFDEKTVATIAAAIAALTTVGMDVYSTMRLKKQGVVSTNPVVNAAETMTPAKLVSEEKAAEAAKP